MAQSLGVRQDVFMVGDDDQLWQAIDTGTDLVDWKPWGGKLTSAGSPIYLPDGRLVIYGRGTDNKCWRYVWHPDTGKIDIEQVFGGLLKSAPAVCMPAVAGPKGDPGKDGKDGRDGTALDLTKLRITSA